MTNFKQLLFRAGFMNFGKLDRKAAMDFLAIKTERTLDLWPLIKRPFYSTDNIAAITA